MNAWLVFRTIADPHYRESTHYVLIVISSKANKSIVGPGGLLEYRKYKIMKHIALITTQTLIIALIYFILIFSSVLWKFITIEKKVKILS